MAKTEVHASQVKDGDLTDADIAAANKDGVAGTASMRTLGTGAQQAKAGDAGPTGTAGGALGGTYPNPTLDPGADVTAVHDNIAGEISILTEKTTPVSGDHLLIEDSVASNVKKRVQIGNLPGGANPRYEDWGSPAQLTADVNNYDPGDVDVARLLNDGGVRTISGLAPTGGNTSGGKGRRITLINISGSERIPLAHQDTGSTAANRIITLDGSEHSINAGETVHLKYDPTSSRWRIISIGIVV